MIKHVFKCGCMRDPSEAVKSHKTGRMDCPKHFQEIDYSIYTCEQCGKKDIGRFTNKRGPLCRDCKAEKTKEYSRIYSAEYNKKHRRIHRKRKQDKTVYDTDLGTISIDWGSKTGTKPDCGFYGLCLQDAVDSKERNPVIPCKTCKIYAPVNALRAESYIRVSDICTSSITELPISPEVRRLGK